MNRKDYFSGKIILITGAASGIGRAIAEELCRYPVGTLILADINAEQLHNTCKNLNQRMEEVVDVTDQDQVDNMFERIRKRFGRIDLLFNIVGRGIAGEFSHIANGHWEEIIRTNLLSTIYCSQAAYKMMLKQGEGQIVNMSSCSGLVPVPGVPYATTKSAIQGFSGSLRIEAAGKGIKINAVYPFFVETGYFSNRIQTGDCDNKSIAFGQNRKKMPAGRCARRILNGVKANKTNIIPSASVKSLYLFYRLFPSLYFRCWKKMYKPSG